MDALLFLKTLSFVQNLSQFVLFFNILSFVLVYWTGGYGISSHLTVDAFGITFFCHFVTELLLCVKSDNGTMKVLKQSLLLTYNGTIDPLNN